MILEILLLSAIALIFFKYRRNIPEGFPPGEIGWPFIGYIPSYFVPISQHVQNSIRKYGKTFTWYVGNRPRVLLCDFKVLKCAFNNPNLLERPSVFSHDFFTDFRKLGIANTSGTKWRNIKRFTTCHLKDKGMGKSSLEEVITYETLCLLKDFQKHVDKIITIPWSINVAVINILWQIIAGNRYEVDDANFQDINKLVTDAMTAFQSPLFMLYSVYPGICSLVPNTLKRYLGLRSAFVRANSFKHFLMNIIQKHEDSLDENNPVDFIDSFLVELKLNRENRGHENTSTFTEEDLLYAMSDLFMAGSETSSSTIKWIIIYMIKYPEIQLKVQRQIDEVVPRDKLPCLQDRKKLPIVEATIYEVMRIKTMTPFGVHHLASEDIVIQNFHIPKGTSVISGIEACHNDPDYWDKPHEFNPDRFILPDGSCNSNKDGFIAFGTGRRSCIGEQLAKMELYLICSALLQKFNFTSPEGVDILLEPDNRYPLIKIPKECKIIIKERI